MDRCSNAERQLTALRDVEDDFQDDTHDDDSHLVKSSSYTSLRRRGSDANISNDTHTRGKNNMINGLEKFGVKAAPAVVKAVDMLDSWTLLTVRLVRSYPLVRLGVLIYLLALHIWVIVILAIHTHSLELETDPKEAIIISRT